MLSVAIIGYGKMGKEIETVLNEFHHDISVIIDRPEDWDRFDTRLRESDVAIEFSTPETAFENCKKCIEKHIPVVTGTTGWKEKLDNLLGLAENHESSLIYGSNFSIGANIFFMINKILAHTMDSQPQYDVSIEEIHHKAKKDAPSGTAISIAEIILEEIRRKKDWTLCPESESNLSINAIRTGDVTGIHKVEYNSIEDTIELKHTAKSRKGFAWGAVKAAMWLKDHPGRYDFKDIFHYL